MKPSFWVWTGADPAEPGDKYEKLAALGVTGVFLGGVNAAHLKAIREAGLSPHVWMWTTNQRDAKLMAEHPEWYMVARSGESCVDQPPYVDYYRWVSPHIPEVVEHICGKAEEIAERDDVDGVHLDYVRYPDVILPTALWDTYKLDQTEELPRYDFDYSEAAREAFRARYGDDPLKLERPDLDSRWLHFRYDAITALVTKVTERVHQARKQVSAAVFPTPSMARKICRQDWDEWPLDFVTPMIYHSFYNEDTEWIGNCVREGIQAARFPVVAGLYMPAFKSPEEFQAGLRAARHRGASGVSIFDGMSEPMQAVLKEEIARWSDES